MTFSPSIAQVTSCRQSPVSSHPQTLSVPPESWIQWPEPLTLLRSSPPSPFPLRLQSSSCHQPPQSPLETLAILTAGASLGSITPPQAGLLALKTLPPGFSPALLWGAPGSQAFDGSVSFLFPGAQPGASAELAPGHAALIPGLAAPFCLSECSCPHPLGKAREQKPQRLP